MRSIILALLLISPIVKAETCESARVYLHQQLARYEFPNLTKMCEYFDEVGLESEADREVYACRLLYSDKCPNHMKTN